MNLRRSALFTEILIMMLHHKRLLLRLATSLNIALLSQKKLKQSPGHLGYS